MNPPPRIPDQARPGLDRHYLSAEARKIVEIAKNDRAPVKSFTEVISADPIFAARFVRLANFAPGLSQRLSTVPHMINAFGVDNLKPLALGLSAFALPAAALPESALALDGTVIALRELWEHALGTAAIAGRFAAQVKNVSPLAAFTAGFVHDIGKVFLCRQSHDRYVEAVKVAGEKMIPSTEAETLIFGMNHVEVGVEWGRQSELPVAPQQVMCFHHERAGMLPAAMDGDTKRMIAIVQAADHACEAESIGNGGDFGAMARDWWEAAGLQPDDWRIVLRAVKEEVEAVREIYGFPKRALDKRESMSRPSQRDEDRVVGQLKAAANGPRGVVIPFPIRAEEAAQNSAKQEPGKLAILVVEDHSSLCDLLSLYFMRHGYHVRTASDGESALEVLSREQIHMVLLDLMLPRVDGFEVLKQIHRTSGDKAPYIIVVSAGASERDRQKVLDLGANEYMPKPFHLLRLLERVQTVERFLL
jgi:CheY-like chemotaxis protein